MSLPASGGGVGGSEENKGKETGGPGGKIDKGKGIIIEGEMDSAKILPEPGSDSEEEAPPVITEDLALVAWKKTFDASVDPNKWEQACKMVDETIDGEFADCKEGLGLEIQEMLDRAMARSERKIVQQGEATYTEEAKKTMLAGLSQYFNTVMKMSLLKSVEEKRNRFTLEGVSDVMKTLMPDGAAADRSGLKRRFSDVESSSLSATAAALENKENEEDDEDIKIADQKEDNEESRKKKKEDNEESAADGN